MAENQANPPIDCVLLVDDDKSTNFLHSLVIKKTGLAKSIKVALNGQEALDFLTRQNKFAELPAEDCPKPDIIFLDINMPVMNGWEFLEAYDQLPDTQKGKMIIVMLTTSLQPKDHELAMKRQEIKSFINKPLRTEDFERLVKDYFDTQKKDQVS